MSHGVEGEVVVLSDAVVVPQELKASFEDSTLSVLIGNAGR